LENFIIHPSEDLVVVRRRPVPGLSSRRFPEIRAPLVGPRGRRDEKRRGIERDRADARPSR